MEENKDEIITRRQFFKRAASVVLPAVAAVVLPSALTSCEYDPLEGVPSTGCNGCSGGCKSGCSGSSKGTTTCRATQCKGTCGTSCTSNCQMVCVTKTR